MYNNDTKLVLERVINALGQVDKVSIKTFYRSHAITLFYISIAIAEQILSHCKYKTPYHSYDNGYRHHAPI